MQKKVYGLTMIELVTCMALIAVILLGFFSFDSFSRHHVINTGRRSQLQNSLAYTLENMSRSVQESIGDFNNPPIKTYPDSVNQTGFQVRKDLNNPQTPSNLSDDTWMEFSLSGHNITSGNTTLTTRINGAFVANTTMPAEPSGGFYVKITDPGPDQGMAVDIGLNGLYNASSTAGVGNPKVTMKTRLISPSSSSH